MHKQDLCFTESLSGEGNYGYHMLVIYTVN